MKASDSTLVLIPCRNEKGRIGSVVRSARNIMPEAHIVVIDDGSSDGSVAEAREAGATIIPHAVNLGYGAALETGYMYAAKHRYRTVLQMDGDGQHLAQDLPALRAPLQDNTADIVIGSRYLGGNGSRGIPLIRRLGQTLFSNMIFVLTGLRLTDPTSGFHGIGPRALTFLLSGVFPCDYPDADVILMACRAGLRIREVPVRMEARTDGKSMHYGLKPVYYGMKMSLAMFVVLLNYRLWRRWRKRLEEY